MGAGVRPGTHARYARKQISLRYARYRALRAHRLAVPRVRLELRVPSLELLHTPTRTPSTR